MVSRRCPITVVTSWTSLRRGQRTPTPQATCIAAIAVSTIKMHQAMMAVMI
jgi:hypothetical protein